MGLLCMLGAYAMGFGLFMVALPAPQTLINPMPEGLVVFTGGTGRVDAAVTLLRRGFDGPVLISGVHRDVRLSEIIPSDLMEAIPRRNLTLDYDARTTRENVLNTSVWAEDRHITNLAVVTNRFHALRCRMLFLLLAPKLKLTMLTVPDKASWQTLFREYNKLLVAPLLM